jgi:hypothetical protein
MRAVRDLSGMQFGRLTVLGRDHSVDVSRGAFWICRCECNNEKSVARGNLLNGSTLSCGCFRNTQGGLTRKHPLWKRWSGMLDRCENSQSKDFINYGGRGISVCARWHKFEDFLADMEATYAPGMTLDRRDVNGNYEPNNCEWSSLTFQARNKRSSFMINTPLGPMNVGEAAERFGINRSALRGRVERGWPMEKIFDKRKYRRSA